MLFPPSHLPQNPEIPERDHQEPEGDTTITNWTTGSLSNLPRDPLVEEAVGLELPQVDGRPGWEWPRRQERKDTRHGVQETVKECQSDWVDAGISSNLLT